MIGPSSPHHSICVLSEVVVMMARIVRAEDSYRTLVLQLETLNRVLREKNIPVRHTYTPVVAEPQMATFSKTMSTQQQQQQQQQQLSLVLEGITETFFSGE